MRASVVIAVRNAEATLASQLEALEMRDLERPLSRYKVAAFERLRALGQVPLVMSTRHRWRYVGRVARCRGSIVGLVRYRIRPS